jgi:hypothetical protein
MKRRPDTDDGAVVHTGGTGIRGLAARAQRQQQPAVGGKLADGVVEIVGAIDGVIWSDENAMRPRK